MAFVFIDQSAPVLLLDFKLDSKQTPVPRIAVVRINILPPAFAIARSKTKRTESEQPRLENGDHRLDIPWARPQRPRRDQKTVNVGRSEGDGDSAINRARTLATPWSRSTLLHERSGALADLFKRHSAESFKSLILIRPKP